MGDFRHIVTVIIATLLLNVTITHFVVATIAGIAMDIAASALEVIIDIIIFHGIYDAMGNWPTVSIAGSIIESLGYGSVTLMLFFAFLMVLSVIRMRSLWITMTSNVTSFSTGEAMNRLPEGVMFFLEDGEVIQSNRVMERLYSLWTGKPLTDGNALWDGSIPREFVLEDKDILVLTGWEGTRWQLTKRKVDIPAVSAVYEVIAQDITQEDELLGDLNRQVIKLQALNERLREYNRTVDETVRKEELLQAKRRIHGNMGSDLLAARLLLEDANVSVEAEEILNSWRDNIRLLVDDTKEPETDNGKRLREAADFLGIDLQLQGKIPDSYQEAELITMAIQECLTNAMQHAGADQMYVVVNQDSKEIKVSISNNGKRAPYPIKEGGGLSTLRRIAEGQGAEITYIPGGCFHMQLTIPLQTR